MRWCITPPSDPSWIFGESALRCDVRKTRRDGNVTTFRLQKTAGHQSSIRPLLSKRSGGAAIRVQPVGRARYDWNRHALASIDDAVATAVRDDVTSPVLSRDTAARRSARSTRARAIWRALRGLPREYGHISSADSRNDQAIISHPKQAIAVLTRKWAHVAVYGDIRSEQATESVGRHRDATVSAHEVWARALELG